MREPPVVYPEGGGDTRDADTEYGVHAPGNHEPGRVAPEDEISLLDVLIVIAKHKRLVIGLPALVGILAVVYSLLQPNIYTATAKVLPPQQSQASGAALLMSQLGAAAGISSLAGAKSSADIYVAMLRSRTLADNLIRRFDLLKDVKYPTQARDRLAASTKIESAKDGLITIAFDHEDPKRAAEIANAYVDELMKLTQLLAVTEASQRRLFFERQFAQAKENLTKAELAARQALVNRGLVKVDDQGKAMVETTGRLRGQITVKEVQIAAMRAFASEDNPELRVAHRELEALRRELAKIEGDEAGDPVARTRNPGQGMDSLRLLRDVKYNEVVFELLAKQFEVAKIDEAKQSSVIQVLDEAVPPDFKSHPKRLQIVLVAVVVALVIAMLTAFVLEALAVARSNPQQERRLQTFKRHLVSR